MRFLKTVSKAQFLQSPGWLAGCAIACAPGLSPPAPDPCPTGMRLVRGGPFLSGVDSRELDLAPLAFPLGFIPLPPAWTEVGSFCMDQLEYPNHDGVLPRAQVTFLDAQRLCLEQGKRLCSEAEFDRACGGLDAWHDPYGEPPIPGACNDAAPDDIGSDRWIAPAGSFWQCVSPEGIYDLQGNVSEWVDASLELDPRPTPPPPRADQVREEHAVDAEAAVVRGGTSWVGIYGSGCHARHLHPASGPTSNDDGFRCCLDVPRTPSPSPSSRP